MINERLDATLKALEQDMLDTLRAWLRVPSVKGDAAPGAPFGQDVRRSLDMALADGKRLGFAARDIDGYACDMEMGAGEEIIGILAHLDVVPAGDGWRHAPFGAEIEGGKLYGRGVTDDKGPAVAALFAMKAVLNAGIPLKKRVRLVLGCDEESGWKDMDYYRQKIGLPAVGFSPDACYPLINTEKGIEHCYLRAQLPPEGTAAFPVYRVRAGQRPNVIPGTAQAEIGGDIARIRATMADFSAQSGWPITVDGLPGGRALLTCTGVTGHASMPELGRNAAAGLLLALDSLGAGGGSRPALALLAQALGRDSDGSGLGIAGGDVVSGPLTLNLGILDLAEGVCTATLDIRYPVMFSPEQLTKFIALRLAPAGFTVTHGDGQPPHHVPESAPVVQTLLRVYSELTGEPAKPLAIGGGTFARAMGQAVAFGCTFPGQDELAHQADEYMSLVDLSRNARIFAYAIVALAG
ncbi:MAG: dipeptidase PepV [Oscillospiraceae bacterium]|jgi:succinyl-diaminopimelate desuccinylase|nr:dipeptidase PepV [Oscillospiraceae bacterium]